VSRRIVPLLAAVAGVVVCISVAAAVPPPTRIVMGYRIGAVKLGEPRAQVTKALGRGSPVRVHGDRNFWSYSKVGIYLLYPPNRDLPRRVFVVMTRSARYSTRSGVGVGSSLRQLRRAVRVGCHPAGRFVVCYHRPRPVTSFLISSNTKRVREIAIASN
jgi:hypothetical protein